MNAKPRQHADQCIGAAISRSQANEDDSPTPLWGRAWYHLLRSEIAEAARWYEKMIETRELFAPVYVNSLYTEELRASPYWPKLARMMNLPGSAA